MYRAKHKEQAGPRQAGGGTNGPGRAALAAAHMQVREKAQGDEAGQPWCVPEVHGAGPRCGRRWVSLTPVVGWETTARSTPKKKGHRRGRGGGVGAGDWRLSSERSRGGTGLAVRLLVRYGEGAAGVTEHSLTPARRGTVGKCCRNGTSQLTPGLAPGHIC